MTFEEFVDWIQYSKQHLRPLFPHRYQLDWFVDPNGNVLAIHRKVRTLDEDWAFVAQKLGITGELPHRRANPRAPALYRILHSRTKDVIANKFRSGHRAVLAMSSPDKIKAIVLTCDRYRAITKHLIVQYERRGRIIRLSSMFPIRSLAASKVKRIKLFHVALGH